MSESIPHVVWNGSDYEDQTAQVMAVLGLPVTDPRVAPFFEPVAAEVAPLFHPQYALQPGFLLSQITPKP